MSFGYSCQGWKKELFITWSSILSGWSGGCIRGQMSTPITWTISEVLTNGVDVDTDSTIRIIFRDVACPIAWPKSAIKYRCRISHEVWVQKIAPVIIYHLQHFMLISQPRLFFLWYHQVSPEHWTLLNGTLTDQINWCKVGLMSERVILVFSVVVCYPSIISLAIGKAV